MFYTSKALHTPIELYKYLLQNEFVLLLWNPAMPPGLHKYPRTQQSVLVLTWGAPVEILLVLIPQTLWETCAREGTKVWQVWNWCDRIFLSVLKGRCWKPDKLWIQWLFNVLALFPFRCCVLWGFSGKAEFSFHGCFPLVLPSLWNVTSKTQDSEFSLLLYFSFKKILLLKLFLLQKHPSAAPGTSAQFWVQ